MYDTRNPHYAAPGTCPVQSASSAAVSAVWFEMVERELLIVKRPSVGKGIVGIKQRDAQRAGNREDPRQTNGAQRLQPVCILHDFASGVVGAIFALKLCASIA